MSVEKEVPSSSKYYCYAFFNNEYIIIPVIIRDLLHSVIKLFIVSCCKRCLMQPLKFIGTFERLQDIETAIMFDDLYKR